MNKDFPSRQKGEFKIFCRKISLLTLTLTLFLSACTATPAPPVVPANVSATLTATTATLAPTLSLPSLQGTAVPTPVGKDASPNGEMTELARWGFGALYDLALSPDGTILVLGTASGTYFYDPLTFAQIQTVKTSDGSAKTILFSPDGFHLVILFQDGTTDVYLMPDGKKLYSIVGDKHGSYSQIDISPDGKDLARISGGYNEASISVYDLASGTEKTKAQYSLEETSSSNGVFSYAANGERLFFSHFTRVNGLIVDLVSILDAKTLEEISVLKMGDVRQDGFSVSPDGNYLAINTRFGDYSNPSEIIIANLVEGKVTKLSNNVLRTNLELTSGEDLAIVSGFAFSPDSSILTMTKGSKLCLWGVEKNSLIKCLDYFQGTGSMSGAVFNSDGSQLFGYGVGAIVRWDMNTLEKISTNLTNDVRKIIPDPNQRYFLAVENTTAPYSTGMASLQIQKLDWQGANLVPLVDIGDKINDMRYDPDGEVLVVAGEKKVSFWSTKDYSPLNSAEGGALFSQMWNKNSMLAIAKAEKSPWKDFTSIIEESGDMTAVAMSDGSIRVFTLPDGNLKYELEGHKKTVTGLYFTPSYTLISVSQDDVCIWDLSDGALETALPVTGGVLDAWLNDPSTLAVITTSMEWQTWDMKTNEMIDSAPTPFNNKTILVQSGKYDFASSNTELTIYTRMDGNFTIPLVASDKPFLRQNSDGSLLAVNTAKGVQVINLQSIHPGVDVRELLLDFIPVINASSMDFNPLTGNLVIAHENVVSRFGVPTVGNFGDKHYAPYMIYMSDGNAPFVPEPFRNLSPSFIVTGISGQDSSLQRWYDPQTGNLLAVSELPTYKIAVSPSGGYYASMPIAQKNDDGQVEETSDFIAGKLDATKPQAFNIGIESFGRENVRISVSDTGLFAASVFDYSSGGKIYIWDISSGKLLSTLDMHLGYGPIDVALSPDGSILATNGEENSTDSGQLQMKLYDLKNPNVPKQISALNFYGNSLTFSPDGKRLFAADSLSKAIYVLDVAALLSIKGGGVWLDGHQSIIAKLKGHTDAITAMVSLPNGTLYSTGADATIRIWGAALLSLQGTSP